MSAVIIRDLPAETHQALKDRARQNGVSVTAHIRSVLEKSVQQEVGLGTQLQEFGRKYGPLPEVVRSMEPLDSATFE